jgi:signal transduction histidine kinase/HAMP domain-containing protein
MRDVKISTQLKVGLGAILLLVVFLGTMVWMETDILWQQTKGLYDHPLQVRRAVGEIKADILSMHRGMKDLVLAESDLERQTILQGMDTFEADAHRQFEIVYDRYLGPRKDIDEAFNYFVQWKAIRAETILLLRAGRTVEAILRTKASGIGGSHAKNLLGHVQEVSNFADTRAEKFYQDAAEKNDTLRVQLAFMVGLIILLSAAIGSFLLLQIRRPLRDLTEVMEHFHQGNLDTRSANGSTNEFGILAAAFNRMAEAIALRIDTEKKAAALAEALISDNEVRKFAETVLGKFMEITESNMGAFYLRNEGDDLLLPLAAVGVNPDLLGPFDASILEGQFGLALKTGEVAHIKDIRQETLFTFKTFAGTAVPSEIITLPVAVNGEVRGILSLACLGGYSKAALNVLNQPSPIALSTSFANLLAGDQTRRLAVALRENNQELQAQQEELQAQAEELRQQTEEIRAQNVELEQQQLAVVEASRLKSQFLSNMSHELRTPLNSVMALSRVLMLQAKTKLSDEEINYLTIIERNGKNLLTLINDILDLAKIESGRMDIRPRSFSLRLTIENIVESIEPLADEKHIQLRQEVPETLPPLESDEIRVSQILQNLIANAVKFTASGSVAVSANSHGGNVSVIIADTGIGIADDAIPYIFDEFRQVDGSSSRRHEGTGLGLAIARKAARMLGGDIGVTSTLGLGATFTLTLPLAWQGAAPTSESFAPWQPTDVQPGKSAGPARILMIEDNEAAIIQVRAVLENSGYIVDVARGGQEAFDFVAHTIPDGIVLDLMMPEIDGFDVLEKIRGRSATTKIPVLILTAKDLTPADFKKLSANNVQQLVQKGDVDQENLLMKIRVMLGEGKKVGPPTGTSQPPTL